MCFGDNYNLLFNIMLNICNKNNCEDGLNIYIIVSFI